MTAEAKPETQFVDVKERRGWKTWVTLGAFVVLGAITAYMAFMTITWAGHIGDVKSTRDGLKAELVTEQERVTELEETHARAVESLDAAQELITSIANDKAHTQDFQDLYSNVSLRLVECARERDYQIEVVKNRSRYTPDSVAKYESSLNKYCSNASKALADLVDEEEEG